MTRSVTSARRHAVRPGRYAVGAEEHVGEESDDRTVGAEETNPLAKGQRIIKVNLRRRTDSRRCPGDGEKTTTLAERSYRNSDKTHPTPGEIPGRGHGRVTKSTPRKRADRRWTPGDDGRRRTSDAGRMDTAILKTPGDTPGVILKSDFLVI